MTETLLTQKLYENLRRSEGFSRQKVIDHQRRLLERLLRQAVRMSPSIATAAASTRFSAPTDRSTGRAGATLRS